MLKQLLSNKRQLGIAYALFLTLFYLMFVRTNFGLVTVELYLDTDHSGLLEVFIPNENHGFSQDNSRRIQFPKGESGHRLGYRMNLLSAPLRLDPTTQKGQVVIKRLVVRHLGFEKTTEHSDLEDALLQCVDATCSSTRRGLQIDSKGIDPRTILASDITPFHSKSALAVALILIGLAALFLLALIGRYTRQDEALFRTFALTGLVIMLMSYWNLTPNTLVPAFLYSILGASFLTKIAPSFYRLFDSNRRGIVDASVVMTGVVFFILWSTISLTSDIHQKISDELKSEDADKTSLQATIIAYKAKLDSVYSKFLYGGKQLINWDAKIKIFGLGFTPNSKTILGKDQWYFEGYGSRKVEKGIVRNIDNITDYMGQNPMSQSDLARWQAVLEERYYWLKEQGIDYVFALAPTKALVYPEKLPDTIYKRKFDSKQPTRYTQLIEYLSMYSVVPIVDLKAAMVSAKSKHQWPLFYRTDFHWNYLGAFYAYQAIMDTINTHYPKYALQPMPIEDFRIEPQYNWAHARFLMLAGLKPIEHKDDTYLRLYPKITGLYGENSIFYEQGIWDETIPRPESDLILEDKSMHIRALKNESENTSMKRIFIIGDSFSEKMTGYFSAHAETVNNYRAVTQFSTAAIKQLKPQIVVQEVLNMYILSEPPYNTKEVAAVRERMPRRSIKN